MPIAIHVSSFSDEVLFNVLDQTIDYEENFHSIRSVCKQWKRIAEDQNIVNRLLANLGRCKFSEKSSKMLIIKFGRNASIINLKYTPLGTINDQFIKDISTSIPNVVRLQIGYLHSISAIESLMSLLRHTPKLKSLSFGPAEFEKEHFELMSKYCPELEELKLPNCKFDREALLVLSKISTLVSLSNGNNTKIDGEALVQFSVARKNLTRLKICGMDYRLVNQEVISIAKNCTELEKLSLYGQYDLRDEALVQLAHSCKKLKFIDLTRCSFISD